MKNSVQKFSYRSIAEHAATVYVMETDRCTVYSILKLWGCGSSVGGCGSSVVIINNKIFILFAI
jgi:hypothetical protein